MIDSLSAVAHIAPPKRLSEWREVPDQPRRCQFELPICRGIGSPQPKGLSAALSDCRLNVLSVLLLYHSVLCR